MLVTIEAFIREQLGSGPQRILEVGCGAGDLAKALERAGHSVVAIDPEAPVGDIFRKTSLEEFSERGPFDAVIANRSLHHVHDLPAGLDKIRSLLAEDGGLILNEFAWERIDQRTADWYLAHVAPERRDDTLLPENFPAAWMEGHSDLHDSETMLELLDQRFARELFEWIPYIAEYHLDRPDLINEEERLGRQNEITLIGFHYVGR